ncbi:uncharacterized protein LOC134238731 [Saccostrea cucullata]|uniref:uncharacterized protein LOC134238731 n=1 Tax=Saccostrea cuccullata TaxID=36930 RepID=UPI002ED297F8
MRNIFTQCCVILFVLLSNSHSFAQDVESYANHVSDAHTKHQALQKLNQFLQSEDMNSWKSSFSREKLLRRASTAAGNITSLNNMLQTVLGNNKVQTILKEIFPQLASVSHSQEISKLLQGVLSKIIKNDTIGQQIQLYSDLMKGNITGLMKDIDPKVLQGVIKSIAANLTKGNLNPSLNTLPGILSKGLNAETIAPYILSILRSKIMSIKSSNQCKEDIINTISGLSKRQSWALKMLDASAKLPPDILDVNINWYGSYDECIADSSVLDQANILPRNPSIPVVKPQYCTVSIYPPVPPAARGLLGIFGGGLIKAGVCVPKSCSNNDILLLSSQFLDSVPIGNQKFYATNVDCVKDRPYETRDIAVITLLGVFLVLMILGTLYDFVNIQYPIYKSGKMDEKTVNNSMDSDGIYKLKSFDENPTNVNTDKKDDKNKDGINL